MAQKCSCEVDVQACCACVSMHCDECHKPNKSKFVQGRFCSNCGRPLKAELTRAYVPKSEVERLQAEVDRLKKDNEYILMQHRFQRRPSGDCWNDVIEKAKAEVAREIFAEMESCLDYIEEQLEDIPDAFLCVKEDLATLKKKYVEGENDE